MLDIDQQKLARAPVFKHQEKHDVESFQWNFFPTSHGKGPVDGLVELSNG
jgi:hypothetical protein